MFLSLGLLLAIITRTIAENSLEVQPYQKAFSVSGLHNGLVAGVDYVVVYAHINTLKVNGNISGQVCGFNYSTRTDPYYTTLCSMTIQQHLVCITHPLRIRGNLCYCENRKKESMTFVLNVTARKEMNDSSIFFWLGVESVSVKIPEPIYESLLLTLSHPDQTAVHVRVIKDNGAKVDLEMMITFQVLSFACFVLSFFVLGTVLIVLTKRLNSIAKGRNLKKKSIAVGSSTSSFADFLKVGLPEKKRVIEAVSNDLASSTIL